MSSREDEHVVLSEMTASWPRAVLHPQQQPTSEFEADVAIATQIAGVLLGGSEASLQPLRGTATATAPPAARGVLACCAALVVWKTISAEPPRRCCVFVIKPSSRFFALVPLLFFPHAASADARCTFSALHGCLDLGEPLPPTNPDCLSGGEGGRRANDAASNPNLDAK